MSKEDEFGTDMGVREGSSVESSPSPRMMLPRSWVWKVGCCGLLGRREAWLSFLLGDE